MQQDRHAAEVVLKVIARRSKILGLDKADELIAGSPRTVLVGGNTEQHLATLQALIAGDDAGTR